VGVGRWSRQLVVHCVRNIRTKNYQNLIIHSKVTVENVGYVFLRQCNRSRGVLFEVLR